MPITDPGLIRPTFSTKTSGSTIPLTFTSTAIPADSLIFAVFAFDNTGVTTPTVSSVSKPAGETASWSITNVDSFQSGSAAGAKGAVAWIKTATAWSAGETITATLSESVTTRVGVATVFYGVGTVSGSIASEQHGSTIALSSGAIPSTGQLVVGGVWTENNAAPAADTDTLDGSWSSEPVNTSGGSAQTNVGMRLHYKITNASSGNPQVLNASVVDGGAALAVFTVAIVELAGPVVTATAVSSSQIDLSWTSIAGAIDYEIERDSVVIVTGHTTTTYNDTGLSPSTTYEYRVRARVGV